MNTITPITDIPVLLWLDFETDGLNPVGGHLLQVAVIPTDELGNELDVEPYEAIVAYTPEEVAEIRANAVSVVQDMHHETGLWDRLIEGVDAKPLSVLHDELLAYVKAVAPGKRQAQIAGNSVRFDLNWAEEHLNEFYLFLHYRNIDVTALGYSAERAGLGSFEGEFVGQKHEAMADIRYAIESYRWFIAAVRAGVS